MKTKTQHYDRLICNDLIKVDVLKALANYHPESIEDYAIQMYYLANNHGFFTCCEATSIKDDLDPFGTTRVKLVIEATVYIVNIQTGEIDQLTNI